MMTDEEAFSALGEVMAQVGNPWPRYSRDEIMRMEYEQDMRYRYDGPTFSLSPYGLTPRI